ncbi:MAG: HD domain-containing protein [Candidatus Hodarchaeales archaeon]
MTSFKNKFLGNRELRTIAIVNGDEVLDFEEGLSILVRENCNGDIILHSIHVAKMSYHIARKIAFLGINIDVNLTEIGGLLHDIGRSRTHAIDHGIAGGKILREYGYGELAEIAERHIGGGISKKEAVTLGLPAGEYEPETIEQKVVCYADKLFQYNMDRDNKILSFTVEKSVAEEVSKLRKKLGRDHPSPKRLLQLEKELTKLAGELPGLGF